MDFGAIKMRNKMLAQLEVGLLLLLCARTAVTMESSQPDNQVVPSCSKFTNVCKFNFRVGYNMTMISWESSKGEPAMHPIVPGEDGYLYKKNNTCMKTRMSKEEVSSTLVGDGRQKFVMVVNGKLPGPPIVVYKGQHVVVTVTNAMENEAMTLHWHGLHMKKTPWMDGGGSVSQCPILPGQIFQYRFQADKAGTHWYHGHIGQQRSMGMEGPLVVLHRSPLAENRLRGKDIIPHMDADFHMMLNDWSLDRSDKFTFDTKHLGMAFSAGYDSDECRFPNQLPDGSISSFIPFDSILINGKGQYRNPETGEAKIPNLPLEVFTVKPGGRFRFRVTNAAMDLSLRVSIDEHRLHLVASDGNDMATTKAESVIIGGGERFDFWINTDDPSGGGNYWVRVESLDYTDVGGKRIKPIHSEAILRYEGAPIQDPVSSRRKCSFLIPCVVVNCPHKFYPRSEHIKCKYITDLRKPLPSPTLVPEETIMDKILSFEMTSEGLPTVINGRVHVPHGAPPQIFPKNQRITPCNDTICDKTGCACTHQLSIRSNDTVQLTFFSHKPSFPPAFSAHPIHMHGYQFQVLKIGWPVYDSKTGRITANSPDIDCSSSPGKCYRPMWSDPSWENGNIPGLTKEGAIEKDTVMVPAGGYVVVRFKADNPGYWLLHCHMETHSGTGMLMVLKEGEHDEMVPVPQGFPQCDDYQMSDEEYYQIIGQSYPVMKGDMTATSNKQNAASLVEHSEQNNGKFMYLSVFLGITLLAVTAILGVVISRMKSYKKISVDTPWKDVSYKNLERTPLMQEDNY